MIKRGVVLSIVAVLAGCGTSQTDTAWKLMERQQEEQAMLRQHEARQYRAGLPSDQELRLGMIREAQNEGRYFASLAYADAHAAEFGMTPELKLLQADALRITGNHDASKNAYQELLGTDKKARAHHGLGLLAGDQGDYGLAARELDEAARLQPADPQVLSDLGYALLRSGAIQRARMPLGQAAELAPNNGKAISNLVLFLLLNDEAGRARQVSEQAGQSEAMYESIQTLAHRIRIEITAGASNVARGAPVVTFDQSTMSSGSIANTQPGSPVSSGMQFGTHSRLLQ